MWSGRIRSFCTPEGAMKTLSLRVGNQAEVHTPSNEIENCYGTLVESRCPLPSPLPNLDDRNLYKVQV